MTLPAPYSLYNHINILTTFTITTAISSPYNQASMLITISPESPYHHVNTRHSLQVTTSPSSPYITISSYYTPATLIESCHITILTHVALSHSRSEVTMKDPGVKLDLYNYDLPQYESCPYILTSPRSLEACKRLGIKVGCCRILGICGSLES